VTGPPLEAELHQSFTPWVADHAARIPQISDLGYDTKRYPEQRLRESKSETGALSRWVPSRIFLWVLKRKLASVLRSPEKAERIIAAFRDVAPGVAEMLDSGKSVALLAGHTDNLFDIAYALAGVQISFGTTRYIRRTGIIVNKLMTREAFRGTPMARTLELLSSVYWVVPDTESTRRWGVPEEAARIVNSVALEALEADLRRGVLVGVIPAGTAARHEYVDGELRVTMPDISPGTARLLSRFDAFLPVAMWDDVAKAEPLCEDVNTAIDELAAATAELTGASVLYHELPVDGRPGADRLVPAPMRPPVGSSAGGS
jgi:hypothetical protein